jgi:hypothetical protein
MKKAIMKKLSKYYVYLLKEENTIEFYVENGWEFDDDMMSISARKSLLGLFVKDLKKVLKSEEQAKQPEQQSSCHLPQVSSSSTPFGESIKLLRDLADLQNGAPLERHRKEWEETMNQVYNFLNKWESQ